MSSNLKQIPQLDSIRFIAAFMVLFHHYLPNYNIASFDLGKYGVEIFFSLSGFLITYILLEQKKKNISYTLILRNFYIKRALRLFPIYYLVLLFWTLAQYTLGWNVWDKGDWIYYYSYTSNWLFHFDGFKGPQLNHTWTLAIEEQFYLIWPLIILFLPKKTEKYFIILLMLASLIFKATFELHNMRMLPLSHFDSLGIGSLLAVLLFERKLVNDKIEEFKFYSIVFPTAILLVCALNVRITSNIQASLNILFISTLIILGTYRGFKGTVGKILDLEMFQYLGKISYGIYLYHKFLPYILINLLAYNNISLKLMNIYYKILLLCITIIVVLLLSHLSYQFIEKKLLNIKSKFDL